MFKPKLNPLPVAADCGKVADVPENHNRDGGPEIGALAWFCGKCQDCAFYIDPDGIKCYYCHAIQNF